jgi:hypothetical protein
MLPLGIGFSKETLFTEAVTTILPQWRCAEIAAAISIQWRSRPPIKLSKLFVSFGRTISVRVAKLCKGFLEDIV